MTLATESCTTTVIADGVSRTFNYSFRIPSKAEADLYLRDANGNVALLDPATWSITGAGPDSNGGTFTYPLAPVPVLVGGLELTLARDVPYTQTTQLTNQSSYSPRTVERGLDRLDMQIQQLANAAGRSVRVSITDGPIGDLPTLDERKGKVVGFDSVTGDVVLFPVPPPASGSEPDGYANVKDYGALGDGSTDDTPAFLAAAATGLSLWLPPGTYKLTSTVALTYPGQGMVGIDSAASVILPVGSGFDVITVGGSASNAVLRDFGYNGLYYDTGYLLSLAGVTGVTIQRLSGPNVVSLIFADDVAGLQVNECYLVDGGGAGITMVELRGTTLSKDCVIRDCGFLFAESVGEGFLTGICLHINGNVQNTVISNVALANANQGLRVSNDVGAAAAPAGITARALSTRHSRQQSINLVAGTNLAFVGTQVDESTQSSGVFISASCAGVYVGGIASNCRRYGVETETGAANVTIDLAASVNNLMGAFGVPQGVGADANFSAQAFSGDDGVKIIPGFAFLTCNGFGAEIELTIAAGQVTAATVTRSGRAYNPFYPSTTMPALVVSGDGAGCILTPTLNAEGEITAVAVTAPGAGYTWAVCRVDAENVAQQQIAFYPAFSGASSAFRADGTGSVKFGNGDGLGLEVFAPASSIKWPHALGGAAGQQAKITVVSNAANDDLIVYGKGTGSIILGLAGNKLGFFQAAGTTKQTITGSRGGNAALASLLTALAAYGIITDGTTP